MKQFIVGVVVIALVMTAGFEVYAGKGASKKGNSDRQGRMFQGGGYGPGAMMRDGVYGPGAMMQGGTYGPGWMHREAVAGENTGWICPMLSGQVQPGTPGAALEMITEEKAQEVVDAFVQKSLPGYTVESVKKDDWRPMYFATVKGENDSALTLVVHGFSGQVMSVFPQVSE